MLPHFNVHIIGFEEIWAPTSCNFIDQENRAEEQGFFSSPAFEEWVKPSCLQTE